MCKNIVHMRFDLSLALCYFVLAFFSAFSITITSLWEKRGNLSAFRTFACSVLSVSPFSWCLGRVAACDCGTYLIFCFKFENQSASCFHFNAEIILCLKYRHKNVTKVELAYQENNTLYFFCRCFLKNANYT